MIEREIKETIKEGNGYKYILFAWEPGGRRGILRWHLNGEVMLSICRHHEGRAHYRHCPNSELPQLLLWSTTTKELVHTSSHITMTSGNSVLMWFSLGWCACRASASLPHTRWTPLPILNICDCSAPFGGRELFCTSFAKYSPCARSMLVALGSLQPWFGWDSMLIVAALHELLLLLLHVPILFMPWSFRFW
jgi:hypothetical protein